MIKKTPYKQQLLCIIYYNDVTWCLLHSCCEQKDNTVTVYFFISLRLHRRLFIQLQTLYMSLIIIHDFYMYTGKHIPVN